MLTLPLWSACLNVSKENISTLLNFTPKLSCLQLTALLPPEVTCNIACRKQAQESVQPGKAPSCATISQKYTGQTRWAPRRGPGWLQEGCGDLGSAAEIPVWAGGCSCQGQGGGCGDVPVLLSLLPRCHRNSTPYSEAGRGTARALASTPTRYQLKIT